MHVTNFQPIARKRLVSIPESAFLLEAAQRLSGGCEMVVVCDAEGAMTGVLTKTDVVRQTGRCAGANCTASVAATMTRDVVAPDCAWLHEVWEVMKTRGFRNLPLVDAARHPLGILNAFDVLQVLLTEVDHEEEMLRDYAMGLGYR